MVFQEKYANNNIQVCKLFAVNGILKPRLANSIIHFVKHTDNQKNLHSLITLLTLLPERSEELESLISKLFEVKKNYSFSLLHEKINTYFLVPFVDAQENNFLSKIEMRLASIQPTEIRNLLNFIENLKNSLEIHEDFVKSILNIASETLINNKEQLFSSLCAKSLIVFAKKGFSDENFYTVLEQKIFDEDFTVDINFQILKSYSNINRTSQFYKKVCKNLLENAKFCEPYSDEILEILDSKNPSNKDLQNLRAYLKEYKNNE